MMGGYDKSKIILVLSSNFDHTVQWLQEVFDIESVSKMNRYVIGRDGIKYYIVQEGEQHKIMGIEAKAYLRAPDYTSLEDWVRIRVRR